VKINNVRVQYANEMIDDARESAVMIRTILLGKYRSDSADNMKKYIVHLSEIRKEYADSVVAIKKLIPENDVDGLVLINKLDVSRVTAEQLQDQVIELALAGKHVEGADLMFGKAYPAVSQWITEAGNFIRYNQERTALRFTQAEEAALSARTIMFILGISAVIFSMVIVILMSLSVSRPLNLVVNAADRISSGDLDVELAGAGKRGDELGILAQSFSKMLATLREVSGQADAISKGNYSADIVPRSEKDALGFALQRMTRALRDNRDTLQRQDWLKTGIARLNQCMGGDPDLSVLAAKVISEISTYLDAQIGAIYLTGDGDGGTLSLVGSYAYRKRKDLSNVFKMGEGLVGQAALEKQQILVRNIPEDYFMISSGLGERVPRFICVTPFMCEGRVKGVVEVGMLNEMTEQQMEYLNKAMPALALAVESAETRVRLAKSLGEAQSLAEELQIQQEELRTSNEELVEQTKALKTSEEELKSQQEELQSQQEELQVTNEELEEKNDLLDRQNRDVEDAKRDIEKKAEELAIASRYKSEFLANMSHELRTPLNSLLILSQSLMDNKEGNLSADQIESARIIQNGGNDLLNLINEILDLSKIEAGRMSMQFGTICISDLVEDIRASFRHMTDKKGLNLEVVVRADAPAEITSDRKRLEQIIKNLISNAIKFTDSGSVTVTFTRTAPDTSLSKSGLSANESLAIEVKDTGIGIAPENQKIIFEAFQQVDGGTARKYGGTGLGLSISRELARLLGGEINVRSELGKGSTFTIHLPVTVAPDRKAEPVKADKDTVIEDYGIAARNAVRQGVAAEHIEDDRNSLNKEDKAILVIEDDPNFARLLYRKCHEKGFKCLVSPTGEEGLELADKYLPSAVLLDITLPGMNGWTVLDALKENTGTRHIPVHIVSGEEPTHEFVRKGAVGHATKPLSQDDLEGAFHKFEQTSAGKPKCVLVVDDNLETRRKTVKTIGEYDVEVDDVKNGEEAMAAIRTGRYDCVILDLGLPDIDGMDLLARLEREGVKLPPVIVYTCRILTREEEAKIREHAESIVIKDVRSQERLLDEVSLFLHLVVSKLPDKQRRIIRDLHNKDEILKNKKVLVVDDDMRTAFAMARILTECGMNTLKAENGEMALRMLEEHPDVDIVLMDIMMPVMDGYEAMKRIRSQERFRGLPIIVLTAKAMPEDRQKCLAAGANDYLAKPVDQKRLLSMMRVWLCR
jgi:signal transduction histidine kinase/DNA-binding response OmpR family regulator/HAMP domain-containing protein